MTLARLPMLARRSGLCAMLPLFALLGACESVGPGAHGCTAIGCVNGLSIGFQASSWPAGTYSVQAATPTGLRMCSVELPFQSVSPTTTCTGNQMQLGTSGSALPASEHSLVGIDLPDTPTQVTVTVLRDGQQLATKTFNPAYKTGQPNGPGCEPTCTNASETLSW